MSRGAGIMIDWADGTYLFALKWGQLIELQEKLDAGPYFILGRLTDGKWRVEDLSNIIRLGLIGGGMDPVQALKKVRVYVEDRPPMESLLTAQAVLAAGLMGAPDEKPGKRQAGAGKRRARSRGEKSGSPTCTDQEPSSG